MAQEQRPKGLLEFLGIQKMDPNGQGDNAKKFYNRDRFKDVASSLASSFNSMSHSPDPNLDARMAQAKQGRTDEKQRNKTVEWLMANGGENIANMIAQNVISPSEGVKMHVKGTTRPDNATIAALKWRAENAGLKPGTTEYEQFIINEGGDPTNFRALKEQALAAGYKEGSLEFMEFMATRGEGAKKFAGQTGTNNANIETGGPAASAIAEGAIDGQTRAKAKANLPAAENTVAMLSEHVDSLISDPYLPEMLGPINSRKPNVTADAARVQAKIDQLKGGVFLQAREALKGAGTLTDFESAKGEAAYSRLETAQNVEDFTTALLEFQYWTKRGLEKIRIQAGDGGTAPSDILINGLSSGQGNNDPLGIRQ